MSTNHKLLSVLALLSLSLAFATPVHAFDGRSGDKIVIQAGDVINDDLYVAANEFVLDGTVNGDVISAANMITVNGQVAGNLIAAANTVVINGTVTGDVWAGGSVLYFGDKAKIGGDIVGGAYSLEVHQGSTVGRDAVMGAFQILLAGAVGRNVMAGANGLEIDGSVGGNVKAAVSDANQTQTEPPPGMFMNRSTVPVPAVRPGLTISPSARITGNLDYVQSSDLTFPAGVVGGSISRQAPPADEKRPVVSETASQKVGKWGLNLLRTLVTLVLLGLFMFWLFPGFVRALTSKLESKPWPSLGLGVVAYAAFFFLILLILFAVILGAVIFGLLTLGGLSGTLVWVGILALLALIIGFVLAASFLTKIVFGAALGRWILARLSPSLVDHRYWPMLIGVTLIVVLVGLLSFPLIPGALGWLLNLVIILFGLGALWLWGRDLIARKPVAAA
jgi:cytoskeletal protein CcmA (bactofilin family)